MTGLWKVKLPQTESFWWYAVYKLFFPYCIWWIINIIVTIWLKTFASIHVYVLRHYLFLEAQRFCCIRFTHTKLFTSWDRSYPWTDIWVYFCSKLRQLFILNYPIPTHLFGFQKFALKGTILIIFDNWSLFCFKPYKKIMSEIKLIVKICVHLLGS